jgi:hypothetical protein
MCKVHLSGSRGDSTTDGNKPLFFCVNNDLLESALEFCTANSGLLQDLLDVVVDDAVTSKYVGYSHSFICEFPLLGEGKLWKLV